MRFLFYRYNNICEADMIEALLSLNHEVKTIDLEITKKNPEQKEILDIICQALEGERFDAVVSVNYYPLLSKICNAVQILYIAWTTDCPVNELLSETVAGPYNRIFCFDYAQYEETRKLNPSGVFYMPLATNVDRWNKVISSLDNFEKGKYASDVSFVGSLYSDISPMRKMTGASEYLQGYLEGLLKSQRDVYGAYFLDTALNNKIIDEFITCVPDFPSPMDPHMNNKRWIMAHKYLGFEVTAIERCEVITSVAEWINKEESLGNNYLFKLYTGSDTRNIPVTNMGTVHTHTQMPLVFNGSKINLNITCKSIRTGIAQRIWDIMGAGGFVLTNYQQELTEYFTIGEDLDIYSSQEELLDKISFYLSHEDVRLKIAQNGYKKVSEQHTFKDRMADILFLAFS